MFDFTPCIIRLTNNKYKDVFITVGGEIIRKFGSGVLHVKVLLVRISEIDKFVSYVRSS